VQLRSLERIVALSIAMIFIRPFVCLSGTGMHCDRTLHFSENLSLWHE